MRRSAQPPEHGFRCVDTSADVAAASAPRPVLQTRDGSATVCAYTVLHEGAKPARGVFLLDWEDGARSFAGSTDAGLIERMQCEEFCGRRVQVEHGLVVETG